LCCGDNDKDRGPDFLYRDKVEKYFDKWYVKSKPIDIAEFRNLDSLSQLGYDIYGILMSDSVYEPKGYEYILWCQIG